MLLSHPFVSNAELAHKAGKTVLRKSLNKRNKIMKQRQKQALKSAVNGHSKKGSKKIKGDETDGSGDESDRNGHTTDSENDTPRRPSPATHGGSFLDDAKVLDCIHGYRRILLSLTVVLTR